MLLELICFREAFKVSVPKPSNKITLPFKEPHFAALRASITENIMIMCTEKNPSEICRKETFIIYVICIWVRYRTADCRVCVESSSQCRSLCREAAGKLTRLWNTAKADSIREPSEPTAVREECEIMNLRYNVWCEYEMLHKCRQTPWAHGESASVCFRALSCSGVY